jgi:hypothetical protein
MKTAISTLVLFLLFAGCIIQKDNRIWQEEGGIAIMEAEHALLRPEGSGWLFENSLEGYMGSGYMVWRGTGDWGPESRPYDSIVSPDRILTYRVQVSTPGTYFLKVRNQHQKEDGDNDVWISVNGSEWGKTYDWQENEWTLDERGTWAKYPLGKGVHTVQMAGRSTGFAVDRLILFLETIPVERLNARQPESKRAKAPRR